MTDAFFDEPQTAKPNQAEVSARYLNRRVLVTLTNSRNSSATDRIRVLCHAREVGTRYGAVRVRVEPVDGDGTIWVDHTRISDAPENQVGF